MSKVQVSHQQAVQMAQDLARGKRTLASCAEQYGVSVDRIRRFVKKHFTYEYVAGYLRTHPLPRDSKGFLVWDTTSIKFVRYLLIGFGFTQAQCAKLLGITRARMQQVVSRYLPDVSKDDYGQARARKLKVKAKSLKLEAWALAHGRSTYRHATEFSRVCSRLFVQKRQNVRRSPWQWDLQFTDLDFPKVCPILGIPLNYSPGRGRRDDSPSFDRINSKVGYIKGNVMICSWRANRIKNDATPEELVKIARFHQKLAKE